MAADSMKRLAGADRPKTHTTTLEQVAKGAYDYVFVGKVTNTANKMLNLDKVHVAAQSCLSPQRFSQSDINTFAKAAKICYMYAKNRASSEEPNDKINSAVISISRAAFAVRLFDELGIGDISLRGNEKSAMMGVVRVTESTTSGKQGIEIEGRRLVKLILANGVRYPGVHTYLDHLDEPISALRSGGDTPLGAARRLNEEMVSLIRQNSVAVTGARRLELLLRYMAYFTSNGPAGGGIGIRA
ncbi:MAG: hypothetical protein KGH58_01805 [Candidatus Micrarchaeota archaeon]|nr:hypothetical protein [Candidatus Micrarchaeota archaeon]